MTRRWHEAPARRLLVIAVLGCASLSAQAAELDADSDAARRRFVVGSELYSRSKYRAALEKFEEARQLKPLPAFDYNIARCLERLERWAEAVVAYKRFLAVVPEDPVAGEVRARIAALEARVAHVEVTPPGQEPEPQPAPPVALPAPPSGRDNRALRGAAIAFAPLALVVAAGGGIALGLVRGPFADLQSTCRFRPCTSNDWRVVEQQSTAGYALLGVGGALAVIDIGLWIAYARQRGERP